MVPRWTVGLIPLVAFGACGGPKARTTVAEAAVDRRTPFELAQAYERGDGVARDYERAAQNYEVACGDGVGERAACRKLLFAVADGRGVPRDRRRMSTLAQKMCEHFDPIGCILLAFSGAPGVGEARLEADIKAAEARCPNGDALACEVLLAIQAPNYGGSGAVEEEQERTASFACKAGVLEGCLQLIQPVRYCSHEAGATRCVEKQVRQWENYGAEEKLDALARVRTACDLGDAPACDSLPGRELSYAELCQAHDFEACGALGCLGNRVAAAAAEAKGIDVSCQEVESREHARHAPPPPTRAAVAAAAPFPSSTPADRPPFRSLAIRHLGTEIDSWEWPPIEIMNLGTRKLVHVEVTAYAYDRAGAQVARARSLRHLALMLEPGEKITTTLRLLDSRYLPDDAVAFDVCYDGIAFDDEGRDGAVGTRDAVGCPEQLPRGTGGARFEVGGSLSQRQLHATTRYVGLRYTTIEGMAVGGSASGLADLASGLVSAAGSETPGTGAGTINIPILVAAIGVIYNVPGVEQLRLSPRTLAKILQGDIRHWDHRDIAKDNPGTRLPHLAITVFRDWHIGTDNDRDIDATRQVASFLARAARGSWRLGDGPAFSWSKDTAKAAGLVGIVRAREGAIAFVTVADGRAARVSHFALIRNRAGRYVAPTEASLAAAARELGNLPGPIDATGPDAYPIAYPSWMVVAMPPLGAPRDERLFAYVRYLLGDGQQLLAGLGYAPLPTAVLARSKASLDLLAPP